MKELKSKIKELEEKVLKYENSRIKNIVLTNLEEADLWLTKASENDERRLSIVKTKIEEAELWLSKL